MPDVIIRREENLDASAVRAVVAAAFEGQPHSNQTEHLIVDKLRDGGALTVSLVALVGNDVVGHIAFSPVTIDGCYCQWYGLAPLAVLSAHQKQGIGSRLVNAGLALLDASGAKGCVVLGEPVYYFRFGFVAREGLTLEGVPSEYFLARLFSSDWPRGRVNYHKAFSS